MTVIFVHCLAAAEQASSANEAMDSVYIVRAGYILREKARTYAKKETPRTRRRHDSSDGELKLRAGGKTRKPESRHEQ